MTNKKLDRRQFFKSAGVVAASSILVTKLAKGDADVNSVCDEKPVEGKNPLHVPRRKLGKFETKVPILSLGGMFDTINGQMLLQRAYDFGVRYWDTAYGYGGGKSEEGMGIYLKKYPKRRKDLFVVSKASGAKEPSQIQSKIDKSLERLNTDYIDLYYGVHGLKDPTDLTNELRDWAIAAKKKGIIKYFGFSTHSNMAECLAAAAELDWIDAIMTTYNYQLIDDEKMQNAVDKCVKKGIALIAMKTQAKSVLPDPEYKPVKAIEDKGYTGGQAKVKVVLQDKRFVAVCSQMPNFRLLLENTAAAMDKTKIDKADMEMLKKTANMDSSYCQGCEHVCAAACPEMPYIRDVMRSWMYSNNYGDMDAAKITFAEIPVQAREKIVFADFSKAQSACPKGLPIAKLVKEAASKFA